MVRSTSGCADCWTCLTLLAPPDPASTRRDGVLALSPGARVLFRFFFVTLTCSQKRVPSGRVSCNRMLKLSSSRGIRIDVPVLSVSWSFEDHSVTIQALRKGLIEHEASDTEGVTRWKSSCPDRLAEATINNK